MTLLWLTVDLGRGCGFSLQVFKLPCPQVHSQIYVFIPLPHLNIPPGSIWVWWLSCSTLSWVPSSGVQLTCSCLGKMPSPLTAQHLHVAKIKVTLAKSVLWIVIFCFINSVVNHQSQMHILKIWSFFSGIRFIFSGWYFAIKLSIDKHIFAIVIKISLN